MRPIQIEVMRPFRWVQRALLVTQRWALFQVAERDRYRLELHGRSGGSWSLMFRAGDAEYTAYRSLLLDERVRGAWNPTDRAMRQYGVFSEWFLGHVLAEHPEIDAARLWFERIEIEDGEARSTGKFVMPIVRERGAKPGGRRSGQRSRRQDVHQGGRREQRGEQRGERCGEQRGVERGEQRGEQQSVERGVERGDQPGVPRSDHRDVQRGGL
ncbi:MAG: hypothetical protein IPQ07_35835 [Myxococcales bacterium]|nr:hypothetical protein [Myxococcales bacterium]